MLGTIASTSSAKAAPFIGRQITETRDTGTLYGASLRYFAEVARTGSLAAASQNLHVAVSAISRQIARLEAEVGASLFERMPRGMVLTKSGEIFAEHVRRTLVEADSVLTEISAVRAPGKQVVRIGCSATLSICILPGILSQLHRENPRMRFVVRSGSPTEVEQWVSTGEVDIGVASLSGASAAVSTAFSVEAPVRAFLRPGHPLARKASLSLDDVLSCPIAISERGTAIRQLIDRCCSARGRQFDPVLVTNNPALIRQFTRLSDGIALSAEGIEADSSGAQALLTRELDEPLLVEVHVFTMKDRRLPATLSRLIDSLRGGLGTLS